MDVTNTTPPAIPANANTAPPTGIVAEAEALAKEAWTETEKVGAKATGVLSSLLSAGSSEWAKFAADWKVWDWTKRALALGILALAGLVSWHYWDVLEGYIPTRHGIAHSLDAVTSDEIASLKTNDAKLAQSVAALSADLTELKAIVAAQSAQIGDLNADVSQLQKQTEAPPVVKAEPPPSPKPKAKKTAKSPSMIDYFTGALP